MSDLPRGFAAAQRAYENASPPDDDELDHYIEQVEADENDGGKMAECREDAFEGEDPVALARLLTESTHLLTALADGRKVTDLDQGEQDQFAELTRESERLASNLADKVRAEAQRMLDDAIAESEEMRAEQVMASREDWQ